MYASHSASNRTIKFRDLTMLFYTIGLAESPLSTIQTFFLQTYVYINILGHMNFTINIIFMSH